MPHTYRIRYRHGAGQAEDEAVVEANSPVEAMVKFRHTRNGRPRDAWPADDVLSVCPDGCGEPAW